MRCLFGKMPKAALARIAPKAVAPPQNSGTKNYGDTDNPLVWIFLPSATGAGSGCLDSPSGYSMRSENLARFDFRKNDVQRLVEIT